MITPIKISNEFLGEGENSAVFISSLDSEIEMLRAKRTSVKTDSDEDESNFAILDSVCPPAELATDHINSDFANRYTQLDHREEEDG